MNFSNIKLTPTLIAIIAAAAGIILMLVLVFMHLGNLNEVRDRIAEEEDAIHMAEMRLQTLTDIRERAPEYEQYLYTLEQLIPQQPQEDTLITSLQHLSQETGVEFSQVNFDTRQENEDYSEMPLNLSFEGNYRSFLHLMYHLQNPGARQARALRVESINLDRESLEIEAKAFYQED